MKSILKSIILKAVLLTIILVGVLSCDKHEDLEVGKTALSEASSDWYVQFLLDGEDIYGLGYNIITTANSADETSLWIDDHQHTWWFKVKCPIDIENLKFSAADLNSKVGDYEVDVTITNGTIVKEGATSPGGSKVDSIYFEAEFSDDPGTIYKLSGYKRTGLAEDEH